MNKAQTALSIRIQTLLHDFSTHEVLIEDLEMFVDLCRQYNKVIKNDAFSKLIDEIEMYLMINYTDDSGEAFLQQFNIISRVLQFI